MIHDLIVVGAGPAGSSAATFAAREGVSTLVLDRASFPRDKVCGDGITPQAIYWLDVLGCVDEILDQTKSCIKSCDLFINGSHVLTGGFPADTIYPDFCVLLDRQRFDHILLRNAVSAGARFESGCTVRSVEDRGDHVVVLASKDGKSSEFRGRMVVGADGVSSVVSRSIGNSMKDGTTAVSLRTYYRDVECEGSPVKVWFDRRFFPGYGWLFVDDEGFANVGLGYAFDPNFPLLSNFRGVFSNFIETDLKQMLRNARPCGDISGGSAAFYRPKKIFADRIMLVGDAANQADPLNGGGIHKAMESAYFASRAVIHALRVGDFSAGTLRRYQDEWSAHFELDWRTAEVFLSIAKNPDLREFCLFVLVNIARLTETDRQFRDFCAGVFSGVISQSVCLSPRALYDAFPRNPEAWASLLQMGERGVLSGPLHLAATGAGSVLTASRRMTASPLRSLDWGLEVATRVVNLMDLRLGSGACGDGPGSQVGVVPPMARTADTTATLFEGRI